MSETPDELSTAARRRLADLNAMVGDYFDGGNGHEAMLDIREWAREWSVVLDALLARLAADEADADQLALFVRHNRSASRSMLVEEDRIRRLHLHDEAVAQREQP